ncbi:MAG TPA: UDP-N-acetylmuramyl peptide synthase [Tissierellia bacterium]|nr:UDP-N-acetylmuramyl peptide synthase [Tissierellia bacterium]
MNTLKLFDQVELIKRPETDLEIAQIRWDSRKVEPGDLFVALVGHTVDGHDYIEQAIANGAVALLLEREVAAELPQFVAGNTREAMALAAANFYDHPSKELTLAMVTASNGKTTTNGMLVSILEAAGQHVGIIGTVAVEYGDITLPAILTTPESVDLQRHLRAMVEAGVSHVCMEASSIGISDHRIDGLYPAVASLNNITPEHIDAHGDFETYLGLKKSLLQRLKPPAVAVYNYDVAEFADLTEITVTKQTFSTESDQADVYVKQLDLSTGRAKFLAVLRHPIGAVEAGEYPIELSIPGFHSVANAMSALTMALVLGQSIEHIQAGLHRFSGVERRFEFIYEKDFIIVDDHFANRGNIDVTLKTLEFMDFNQVHMVYAIRGNRGYITNRDNAEGIAEWYHKLPFGSLTATLSQDYTSDKDKVSETERRVFEDTMQREGIDYTVIDKLEEAVARGLSLVQPGDVLLLVGCQGMDFGGHLALMQLEKAHPEYDPSELYAPIKHRVAGIVGRDYAD